jgi:PKD domain
VELLVAALVVVGLLVVAGRFLFRSKSGEIVLPAILDESVGMWALRRVTGLRLWERQVPADDEVAGSATVPPGSTAAPGWSGAPASTAVAWPDADPNARYQSARRSAAAASGAVAGTPAGPSATAGSHWPNRLAVLLAIVSLLMIVFTVVGLTVLPRDVSDGAGADRSDGSGGPGGSAAAVVTGSTGPDGSASASGAAGRSAGPAAPSGGARSSTGPAPGSAAPPSGNPSRTAAPTPAPTTVPTPAPTRAPTPSPAPLKAAISCSAVVLLATCNGNGSTGATTYRFDFGDGTPAVKGPSPLALHTYLAGGTYTVTLTVTDGQGHSATDTTRLKVGL